MYPKQAPSFTKSPLAGIFVTVTGKETNTASFIYEAIGPPV